MRTTKALGRSPLLGLGLKECSGSSGFSTTSSSTLQAIQVASGGGYSSNYCCLYPEPPVMLMADNRQVQGQAAGDNGRWLELAVPVAGNQQEQATGNDSQHLERLLLLADCTLVGGCGVPGDVARSCHPTGLLPGH
ncbi:hypothetical protein AAFF_G00377960 [Aldrovandia affinis]|uniref:Uncharacterized protein n=1 Tax=Aldrovandia affinis TaxID=143900 RepID=A0AAD7SFX0_9TELE|nr:hypothetical protein AAFF_G00377960 [Aldrovandia affinis]